jgi:hypothetical protein
VPLTQHERKKAKTSQAVFDMADSVRDVAVALREPDANGSPVRCTHAIQALGKETNLDVTQRVILARRIMKNTALADTYLASLDFPDMREGVLAAELEEAAEESQLKAMTVRQAGVFY